MNESYTTELLRYNPPFPFSFVIKVREKPVEIMKPDILRLFSYKLDVIENACMDEKHLFRNEMIKNAVLMFFMDISNIHIQQEEKEKVTNKTERKKELFIQFMKLVSVYATKEHSVEFYASKLCITRQYLNRITQLNFRKTAYELISLVLTGEITKYLETTNDSILQVSEHFNFPDQASLTKFYKHQTGYSPTAYKKKFVVK